MLKSLHWEEVFHYDGVIFKHKEGVNILRHHWKNSPANHEGFIALKEWIFQGKQEHKVSYLQMLIVIATAE